MGWNWREKKKHLIFEGYIFTVFLMWYTIHNMLTLICKSVRFWRYQIYIVFIMFYYFYIFVASPFSETNHGFIFPSLELCDSPFLVGWAVFIGTNLGNMQLYHFLYHFFLGSAATKWLNGWQQAPAITYRYGAGSAPEPTPDILNATMPNQYVMGC